MTATRADYPRVRSVLEEINRRPNLDLKLIVTGMHLLPEFGNTVDEILEDGFEIYKRIEIYDQDDTPYGMAKTAARCSLGIADALDEIKPDLFLITVDRIETLAAAQSVAYMNIPMAHIQGGEVTGTIDESIRHAVTKLSHIHFPATEEAAERIVKMGELPEFVFPVGCPYIDIIKNLDVLSKNDLSEKYGFDANKKLVIFTQHPVTTEYGSGSNHLDKTIEALEMCDDLEIISIYSNADAGGREIIKKMNQNPSFHVFPNIPDTDFLSLMNVANLMIGNSSAGIREAPSFKLPVVNIGSRQNGRFREANVIDVDHSVNEIKNAIDRALSQSFAQSISEIKNPYGDGGSASRIVDILEKIDLNEDLINKRIAY